MADVSYPIDEEKSGGTIADSSFAGKFHDINSDTRWMFREDAEKVWCSQAQDEVSKAENDPLLYSSRIINNYVEYLQEYYPNVDMSDILKYAGMSEQEVEDPGHWFSQQQTDRFHEIVVARTGNRHIPREAGRFSVSCKRIGAAKQFALGFVNPASIYLRIGKLAKTLSRGAVLEGKKLGRNNVEIVSTPIPETREKRVRR